MKAKEIVIGEIYIAKVSGVQTKVKILSKNRWKGWDARNLRTRRGVHIKTAGRLTRAAPAPTTNNTTVID